MKLNNNWIFNKDDKKWTSKSEGLNKDDFESLKQDFESFRFYQKCLSGSTYVSVQSKRNGDENNSNINDIYEILKYQEHKSFYFNGLQYIESPSQIPNDSILIDNTDKITDVFTKNFSDYNFSLKNLHSPERLIKDQKKNLHYVDLATTTLIDNINQKFNSLIIDNVNVKEGHRILVKNQYSIVNLNTNTDPKTIFIGYYEVENITGTVTTYRVWNSQNGIYKFTEGRLVREKDLDIYEDVSRYSIVVKLGDLYTSTQFKVTRLLNGYYPLFNSTKQTWLNSNEFGDPVHFKETNNYVLRNRIDYNNLYELVLNSTIKTENQTLLINDNDSIFEYFIPERIITVGEFGSIIIHQKDITTIISNKYKYTLNQIVETSKYYWICGDNGILLRVNKWNLEIKRIKINNILTNFNSISFFDDLKGVVVGDFNQIWYSKNGGDLWEKIELKDFDGFNYNTVTWNKIDRFYVGGDNGVFIEFKSNLDKWFAYKRRISKLLNGLDNEFILLDNIKKLHSYEYNNSSFIVISTEYGKIFIYDINNSLSNQDFLAVEDFNLKIEDDIFSIFYDNNIIYFTTFESIYKFDLTLGNIQNNTNILQVSFIKEFEQNGVNDIYVHNNSVILCGNFSLWKKWNITLEDIWDDKFFERIKPRLLFMDYDVGSKLYWFDDFNQYRLPERIQIEENKLTGSLEFTKNTNTIITNGLTQSYDELNWIEYWCDRQKTFEYYTNLDDSNIVKPSFLFKYASELGKTFSYTQNEITTNINDIIGLAPNLIDKFDSVKDRNSRFRNIGIPIDLSNNNFNLYFKDYLGIWRISLNSDDTIPNKGDVLYINSDVFEGKFIVNKIISTQSQLIENMGTGATLSFSISGLSPGDTVQLFYEDIELTNLITYNISDSIQTFNASIFNSVNNFSINSGFSADISQNDIIITSPIGSIYNNELITISASAGTYSITSFSSGVDSIFKTDYYLYFYTDFGLDIVNDIVNLNIIEILNLNKFENIENLVSKLNKHYLNLSYDSTLVSDGLTQSLLIDPKYSQFSAYYNIQTKIIVTEDDTTEYIEEIRYPKSFLNFGYSPTYNILNYLNNLDSNIFQPNKVIHSMPNWNNIPGPQLIPGDLENQIFIDIGIETNKLKFGKNLKYIWDTLLPWIFVDIVISGPSQNNIQSERMLIIDKYYDEINDWYILEFDKKINYSLNSDIDFINIYSRRTLQQISDDLQYINNIHRTDWLISTSYLNGTPNGQWSNLESKINFKLPTDSYTKYLLGDSDFTKNITGVIYRDYKEELSTQIVNLNKEFELKISLLSNFNGDYRISFNKKHYLETGDYILIYGDYISNQQSEILGFHNITKVNDFSFTIDVDFVLLTQQNLNVKIVKIDSFLNYQPIDIFDLGITDKKLKKAVK
jgi:hypothetical protein